MIDQRKIECFNKLKLKSKVRIDQYTFYDTNQYKKIDITIDYFAHDCSDKSQNASTSPSDLTKMQFE